MTSGYQGSCRSLVREARSDGDSWQILLLKSGFEATVIWLILGQVTLTGVFGLLFC